VPRRAGVVREIPGAELHPTVARSLDDAAAALVADGWEVVEATLPNFEEVADLGFRLLLTDLDLQLGPVVDTLVSNDMRRNWQALREAGVPLATVPEYVDALARRTGLIRAWLGALQETPILVAPLMTGGTIEAGQDVRSVADADAVWRSLRPSYSVNFLGLPAALAPTGLADGRPTGVQLIGSRYREDVCLDAAESVERATGPLTELLWSR
jgi:amidase